MKIKCASKLEERQLTPVSAPTRWSGLDLTHTPRPSSSAEEINKGNDIIGRIQAEHNNAKAKLKLKSDVIREQEKKLEEARERVTGLERDKHRLELDLDTVSRGRGGGGRREAA